MLARLTVLAALVLSTHAFAGGKRLTKFVGKINLNAATVEQLELLPGVGKKAAEKIVAFREKRKFTRIQELVRVKGFGRKKFLKLQPLLAVEGENTLRIESISEDGRHLIVRTAIPASAPAAAPAKGAG